MVCFVCSNRLFTSCKIFFSQTEKRCKLKQLYNSRPPLLLPLGGNFEGYGGMMAWVVYIPNRVVGDVGVFHETQSKQGFAFGFHRPLHRKGAYGVGELVFKPTNCMYGECVHGQFLVNEIK